MNTTTSSAAAEHAAGPAGGSRARAWLRADRTRRALAHMGLPVAIAVSAVMNTYALAQNGYANVFYAAGTKSMLASLHNFVFASFDPGGLISVDKPPLALWAQVASARLFGFTPLSLLLVEAVVGVLTVALLYVVLARRVGPGGAFAGALALAVFPSFVAVSRDNGVEPLLLLLMVAACATAVRACESGRWRDLLASAALVGLAFNTKTLAAGVIVPGIALAYLVCAPLALTRRMMRLLAAGALMLTVSLAWIALVEFTPASQRPYVGSSKDNSELGLTFQYNGLGRVEGQYGGPGHHVKVVPGAFVPESQLLRPTPTKPIGRPGRRGRARRRAERSAHRHHAGTAASPAEAVAQPPPGGEREAGPIPFAGPPGPLRAFGKELGDQGGWLLPFALFGMLALAVAIALAPNPDGRDEAARAAPRRRDPRLALLFVLGGWFVVEATILSISNGIVHPYYMSDIAPAAAAMVGAGAAALAALLRNGRGRRRLLGISLATLAVGATVAAEEVLMVDEGYMRWFIPALIGGCVLALVVLAITSRFAPIAIAVALALLLATPAAYSSTTWLAPVEGTFPEAGPKHNAGAGGYGLEAHDLAVDRELMRYVRAHQPSSRWELLTVSSIEAAPMILMGLHAGALAGYSGTDPALDGRGLARLVRRGEARYVLLGGDYALRGGNGATQAVLRACEQLPAHGWGGPSSLRGGVVLFDCAGRAAGLAGS